MSTEKFKLENKE